MHIFISRLAYKLYTQKVDKQEIKSMKTMKRI